MALDEIEAAHRAVSSLRRGRRYAAQQINQAYVVLLSSQFQRFCRDLHVQCVEHVGDAALPAAVGLLLRTRLTEGRKLDVGNPSPGNIGSDFGRLGVSFWENVRRRDRRNQVRQHALEVLNWWRNAVAHQDFRDPRLGGRDTVSLTKVRRWRSACDGLAVDMERVMYAYLLSITGAAPW
jgi:hypothetical protein